MGSRQGVKPPNYFQKRLQILVKCKWLANFDNFAIRNIHENTFRTNQDSIHSKLIAKEYGLRLYIVSRGQWGVFKKTNFDHKCC